jgi:Fe2+ or Zn2+ uptake regulation protein
MTCAPPCRPPVAGLRPSAARSGVISPASKRIRRPNNYNALEALVDARLATKITSGDGCARYDCRGEDHYHLRDVETGEVRDLPAPFDQQLLEKLDPQLVDRLAQQVGFQVTGYRLEVLGRFDRQPGEDL